MLVWKICLNYLKKQNKQEKINGSENEGFEFLVTPALIKYVYDHRKNKKATEKQIKELYDKFVNHIKKIFC